MDPGAWRGARARADARAPGAATRHRWVVGALGDPRGIRLALQEPSGCGQKLQGLGWDPKLMETLRSREASGQLKEEPGPELEDQSCKPGREHGLYPEVLGSQGKDMSWSGLSSRRLQSTEQLEEEREEVGRPGEGGAELDSEFWTWNRANNFIKQMGEVNSEHPLSPIHRWAPGSELSHPAQPGNSCEPSAGPGVSLPQPSGTRKSPKRESSPRSSSSGLREGLVASRAFQRPQTQDSKTLALLLGLSSSDGDTTMSFLLLNHGILQC
nr:uncharacterized protein LOC115856965 [Globicephala melas]